MSGVPSDQPERSEYLGIYSNGVIRLAGAVDWADGTPVSVRIADVKPGGTGPEFGKVIIAGFGLAGRFVADIFDRHFIDYMIVEQNPETLQSQRKLGRTIIYGDIAEEETLRRAGIEHASILALTIPDEEAVLRATKAARALNPSIYIVARTTYSSSGMQVAQSGADDVIKAEQVVARQFYEMLLRKLGGRAKLLQDAKAAGQSSANPATCDSERQPSGGEPEPAPAAGEAAGS